MNENSLIIIKELTASMPVGSLFLPYGDPPNGWSGVLFEGNGHVCRSGKARFFNSDPRDGKQISAFEKQIALVSSSRQSLPFDLVSWRMLDMDVQRFQFRKLFLSVPKGELPLYSDPLRRVLYTFALTPSFRGIIDRSTRNGEQLEIPVGSRVLQHGRLFARSTVDRSKNIMEIGEYPKWSGSKARKKRYRFKLPRFYSLGESQAVIDFRTKTIAVSGAGLLAKRKWGKVFFIDYRRGKQLAELNVGKGLLADTLAVDPFGNYIAINIVRETNGKTVYLALFDLSKRKLHKLSLRPTVRSRKKASRP